MCTKEGRENSRAWVRLGLDPKNCTGSEEPGRGEGSYSGGQKPEQHGHKGMMRQNMLVTIRTLVLLEESNL